MIGQREMPKLKKPAVHKTKMGFSSSDASGVWIYLEEGV